tara:strand:- start:234 stop:389 length:156 start_codon:yes stop_codon:yes gene_type:complete
MKKNTFERKNIINFIKHLNERNFSKANKSLENVLHEKIKSRIAIVAKKPLF